VCLTDLALILFVGKVPACLQGIEVRNVKPPCKRSCIFSPGASTTEQQVDYDAMCAELLQLHSQIRVYHGLEAMMVAHRDELLRLMEGAEVALKGPQGSEGSGDEVEES
jgi:hypothetical protein